MYTKQTIAIIGAESDHGSAVAERLARGNYRLLLCAGAGGDVAALAARLASERPGADVAAVACAADASWEADVILLTVPYEAELDAAARIRRRACQKVVVSTTNPPEVPGPAGTSAAEALQRLLPDSKVVKAFNAASAVNLRTPSISGQQPDLFLAGDSSDALALVSDLIAAAGFNPVVAGPLSASGVLEQMQLLLSRLAAGGAAGWKLLRA